MSQTARELFALRKAFDPIVELLNIDVDASDSVAPDDPDAEIKRTVIEIARQGEAVLDEIRALMNMAETLLPALGLDTADFNGDVRAATAAALAVLAELWAHDEELETEGAPDAL